MTATTPQTPVITATQRPSEDVIDRALRHIRNGILAHIAKLPNGLTLPSGNTGPGHEVTRQGDTLHCTCLAGQKGQMCWAVTIYQMLSGLNAGWPAADPPVYHTQKEDDEDRPTDTEPTTRDQILKPEPEPATKPSTTGKRTTRKQRDAIAATIDELDEADLIRPTEGRKIAWFGASGFGVHIRYLDQAEESLGADEARDTFQAALAATAAHGTCAVCGSALVNSNNGRNRVCWDHGLFIPAPQSAEEAA